MVFCTYLVYNTVVLLCQFLDVVGNSSQNENIFLIYNLIGLLYVVGRLDMYRTYVLLYRTMVLMTRLTKVRR